MLSKIHDKKIILNYVKIKLDVNIFIVKNYFELFNTPGSMLTPLTWIESPTVSLGYIFIGLHCTSNVNFTLYTSGKSVQYCRM